MPYNVFDIANKIIGYIADRDYGDAVTNMKLQKLLYYQQGFHIAYFKEPLFEDDIEAWMYGPVVPQVYERYKPNGNNALPCNTPAICLDEKEELLFNEVMRVYGEYSAVGLMNLTHKEAPWKETPTGVGSIIPKSSMSKFFKKKIR